MQCLRASILLLLLSACEGQCSLSFDTDNYLEVYPDPRDSLQKGLIPLYFSLIQVISGPFAGNSGSVAGVKVALDRINNDSSLLPGYTLHYTLGDSEVVANLTIHCCSLLYTYCLVWQNNQLGCPALSPSSWTQEVGNHWLWVFCSYWTCSRSITLL